MHIGYCGVQCNGCEVYKAAHTEDPIKKLEIQKKIAQEWTTLFHYNFDAEQMVCEGCKSDRLCGYCAQCQIRLCAKQKEVQSCQECDEYSCEKLRAFKKQAMETTKDVKFAF